jgi:hypothetical protein
MLLLLLFRPSTITSTWLLRLLFELAALTGQM